MRTLNEKREARNEDIRFLVITNFFIVGGLFLVGSTLDKLDTFLSWGLVMLGAFDIVYIWMMVEAWYYDPHK